MIMSLFRSRSAFPSISYERQEETFRSAKGTFPQRGGSERKPTCFLKTSAWGPRAWGSASLMNQTTSSTDQVVGSLLAGALDSWASDGALYPKKTRRKHLYLSGISYGSAPGLLLPEFPTCPVAFWE